MTLAEIASGELTPAVRGTLSDLAQLPSGTHRPDPAVMDTLVRVAEEYPEDTYWDAGVPAERRAEEFLKTLREALLVRAAGNAVTDLAASADALRSEAEEFERIRAEAAAKAAEESARREMAEARDRAGLAP